MTNEDIRKALSLTDKTLLFCIGKFDEQAIGENVCALLNSKGGFVVSPLPDEPSLELINNSLYTKIVPQATIFVSKRQLKDNEYLCIEVPQGHDRPYSFHSKYYLLSPKKQKVFTADTETIIAMMAISSIQPLRWERQFSDEFSIDEMERQEKQAFINLKHPNGQYLVDGKSELAFMKGLEKIALMREGRLTNAADIIFSRNPAIRHPQAIVKAVCGTNKTNYVYQDYQVFEGPLLLVLENLLAFIRKHISYEVVFTDNTAIRQQKAQYPYMAIREGLVNAFAHRDYSSYSGGIQVEILSDKIVIRNSGSLPEGVTVKSLNQGQVSVLRNPDIARYMHLRGYMEMIGRGSMTIIEKCQEAGLKAPKWEVDDNSVTLTLYADKFEPKLTETALKIINMLSKGPLGKKELATQLGLKSISSALNKAISQLYRDFHFIEWTIPEHPQSKSQRYRLTDKGKTYLQSLTH